MDWFRMYSEFASDPKVQSMSEAMQRRLTMLFCLRGGETLHTLDDEELAFALRIDADELQRTKEVFIKKGFIDDAWALLNWDKRQFVSDSSKERVAKYREKRKSMGLTGNGYMKHSVTVMERDGHACVYCSSTEKLCIDHAYPVILGGNDDVENLVCACKACNSGKAGRTPAQAGYSFANKKAEAMWNVWMAKKGVTVTVTPQIQNRTDTDTEQIQSKEKTSAAPKYSALDDLVANGVEQQTANDWLAVRKGKKAAPTKTSIEGVLREISKAGMTADSGIRLCCERGWAGFNPAWLENAQARASPQSYESEKDKQRRLVAEQLKGAKHGPQPTIIDIN